MMDQDEHALNKCRGQSLAGMSMETRGTRKDNDKSNQSRGEGSGKRPPITSLKSEHTVALTSMMKDLPSVACLLHGQVGKNQWHYNDAMLQSYV